MNKKITKVLTLASAVAMPIVSAAPVFAQGAEKKSTGPVEITGFETETSAKPTVTAYRVVAPTYRGKDITGFEAVGKLTFEHLNKGEAEMTVSNAEIEAAAKAVLANKEGFTASKLDLADGKATGNLEPGMYIVLIEGSGATVYNPVLVSVNVADANGGVAATEAAKVDLGGESNAFVKKSKPTVDKKIVGQNGVDGAVMEHNAEIKFEIDTTIPSYKLGDGGTVFKKPTFNIIDTMSDGFEKVDTTKITVKAGKTDLVSGTDYNVVENGKGFKIEFTEKGLLAYSGQAVVVNYTAKLAKDAQKGIKANTNTAHVEYTKDPGDETPKKPEDGGEDKTYNYTFDLKGAFKKVDDNDKALEGAEFTVYGDKECTKPIGKAVSDKQGMIAFEGLSLGTVYIRETKAPAGYSINDTTYQVEVSATFQETGALASYDIKVGKVGDKELKTVVTEQPKISADGEVTKDAVTKAVEIKNTTMGKMPSTGGVGTLMFTGAGVSLFLGSAAAYAKAKKANRKED